MRLTAETMGGLIDIDSSEEFGGTQGGIQSKPLMLVSLAGCTSMDVLSILGKMRIEVADFEVEVTALLSEEHPRIYKETHIIYHFAGANLDKEKIEKAVDLSYSSYCGVITMFGKFSTVTKEIRYR